MNKTLQAVIVVTVVALLGAGIWWALTRNTTPPRNNTPLSKSNTPANVNMSLGVLAEYRDPSGQFVIPLPGRWTGRLADSVIFLAADDGLELNLRVVTKSPTVTLMQYVELQTTKAPVGEGKYEPLAKESIGGFECVKVIGTYVGRFTYDYCALSSTEVLVIGGAATTDAQLGEARTVITGIAAAR